MLAAREWLASRRDVDPQRIAIAGGSYGGYLAALLPGLTDRFAASVVHAGVFDLTLQFASDSHWDRPSSYGNAPWTDPVELDRWSPSRWSPKFSTPTLILHGEKDYRVPVTQGINLHGVLTGKGVPARIVVFPDENHWILKPQASKLWYGEVFAWLDRWMKPGVAAR
jgi:dipeptidyl aminopeptidase/acylaminoacyl peptidase